MVEVLGATQFIDRGQVLLKRLRNKVEEEVLVHRSFRSALGTRTVVGDHHDQRVVQLAHLSQEIEDPAELVVCVLKEARVDLHHPRVELLLFR